jgi:hypothetical protein
VSRPLMSICLLTFISLAGMGCAAAPSTDRPLPSMRQYAKTHNVQCTADQRRGCWAEFKCAEGSMAERAGCRATRRECLAACVR